MNLFTVVGNVTEDPKLRYTPSGTPVVNFSIAETPRKYDSESRQWKDSGETNYYRCTVWNKQAENVAETVVKGTRVIAVGKLRTEKYERNGEMVTSTNNLDIDHIGPSLAHATATVTRNPSEGGNTGGYRNNGGGYSDAGNSAPSNGNYGNAPMGGYGSTNNDPPF
ncbi:MAG: single-stranded DNA-binding protein [Enterococcus sp.]|nr:single-stranded DNA-binding protein [Enterococcus sp.]